MTSQTQRTKRVKASYTEAEYAALCKVCPQARLASWIRQVTLKEANGIDKRQSRRNELSPRPSISASPDFIFALARLEAVLVNIWGVLTNSVSDEMQLRFLMEKVEHIISLELNSDDS